MAVKFLGAGGASVTNFGPSADGKTFMGKAPAGSTVSITDGSQVGSPKADATGLWTYTFPSAPAVNATVTASAQVSAAFTVSAPATTLTALTVSSGTATIGTPYTGTVSGQTAGSTLSLSGTGAAGLSISGATISGTPTAAGSVNVVETLSGATNSPRTTSGLVTVTAAASVTLNALTISSGTATVGVAYTGTITGKTSGSTLSVSGAGSAGLTITGATLSGTPTTAGSVDVIETLAGATNSPRTTTGLVTVTAAASPAALRTAQMNFTQANPANNAAWNDVVTNTYKSPATIALKDPSGVATGWTATWTLAPQYDNTLGNTGIAGIPDNIAISSVYVQTDTGQKSMTLRLAGLVAGNAYKIQSYNSRTANGSAARPLSITAGGGTVQVDALGNSTIVSIPSAVADTNGNLDIVFAQVGTAAFVHLNALILSETTSSGGSTTTPASGSAPSNAVTYGGDPVTYNGDLVTYGA
ncbi:hypothetical protein MKK70_21255 [Methylobacterium sp. E-041]|uniref:beta strand repeat-containing protein n=1 Tax=Methylobacterium sp. E-041 TaxID=2836573 RepID=UPI001FB90309|nr:hypothetical protein [Methylobacterium sp. E-041]MCJ2107858.1 hypothetical protein [Methylobacterium sp. E-041]